MLGGGVREEKVWLLESLWHLIIALSKVCSCVIHLLSPQLPAEEEVTVSKSLLEQNFSSLALKNPQKTHSFHEY